jgi:hypothetical protein
MNQLSFNDFIDTLGWSEAVKDKLRSMALRADIKYLAAWDNAGKPSASAFTERPDRWPDNLIAVWSSRGDDPFLPTKSKTMQAIDLVEDGLSVYAAAKQLDINTSAVHRAIARRADKDICPCCHQVIRNPVLNLTSS